MTQKDYEWYLHADLRQYKGEWVAIAQQRVVAHGANAKVVLTAAKKKVPREQPALAKVPTEEAMIIYGRVLL